MEINPVIVFAAGTVAVGLVAATAICYRPSRKSNTSEPVLAPLNNASKTKSSSSIKSKKKSKSTKKSKTIEKKVEDEVEISATEIAVDTTESEQQESLNEDIDDDKSEESEEPVADAPVEAEAESNSSQKRNKKSKETPEQKTARLDRQKAAKLLVKSTTGSSVTPSVGVSPTVFDAAKEASSDAPSSSAGGTIQSVVIDGWAVVEDRKKSKLLTKITSSSSASDVAESASSSSKSNPKTNPNPNLQTPAGPAPVATHAPIAEKESFLVHIPAPSALSAAQPPEPAATTATPEVVKVDVVIDSKKVGAIIGAKGATMRALQEATGAEITLPRDRDSSSVTVSVSGSAEGVAKLVKAVSDIASKGYTALLEGDDFSEGHVSVHPIYVPDIIGKGGSVRRAIETHTGARVTVPPGVSRDQPTNVKIGLAGPKDKVAEAKKIIKEITRYFHSPVTHPGLVHQELELPASNYNIIIGRGGCEIRHIQGNFKVSVHIPNENSVAEHVILVGEAAAVEAAHRYILKLIDQVLSSKDRNKADADAVDKHVDEEEDEAHEDWMDEFTHPSKRKSNSAGAGVVASSGSQLNDAFPALSSSPAAAATATPVSNGVVWGTAGRGGGGGVSVPPVPNPSQAAAPVSPSAVAAPLESAAPGLGISPAAAAAPIATHGSWAAAVNEKVRTGKATW